MEQSRLKNFYYSPWFILFCLVLIVFFVYGIVRDYYQQRDLRADINNYEKEIIQLKENQDDLFATMDYIKSEDFVELEARTKLNLRKPGEKIIVVSNLDDLDLGSEEDNKETSDNIEKKDQSNWQRWWSYFFNNL